jgi:hypothetical protein
MRIVGIALCAAALSALAARQAEADTTAVHVSEARSAPLNTPDAPVEDRKSAARTLALQGFDLLQAGQYEKAIHHFTEAEKLYHAPTIVLLLAEAHEKLGKLVEARAFYRAITIEELPRTAPLEFFEAQRTAQRNIEALDKRLPTLQVLIPGVPPDKVRVTVDGASVAPSDQAHAQNPGRHLVAVAYDGGATVTHEVVLAEGATDRVVIPRASVEGAGMRTPAAIALGAGAVGLGVGIVAGVVAFQKANALPEQCAAGRCLGDEGADGVARWTAVSLVGVAAAGIGLGTGAALLYFNGPRATASAPQFRTAIGPGSIVVMGSF